MLIMLVRDIISALSKCNVDREIIVFDEQSVPYRIKAVLIDTDGDGEMSNIVIEQIEE